MKKILILSNSSTGLYDFRNELIKKLSENYKLYVGVPDTDKMNQLKLSGAKIYITNMERRGMNVIKDMALIVRYIYLIMKLKPDMILTYTIKPNIYGSIVASIMGIPYINNITGLGSVFQGNGLIKRMVVSMYRIALSKSTCIFYQNIENRDVFLSYRIGGTGKNRIIPGSGVNIDFHVHTDIVYREKPIFLFVGRIMKEKGIDEVIEAARANYRRAEFVIVGEYEEAYSDLIDELCSEGILRYVPYVEDMRPYYQKSTCILVPSYHEGMSNVVLEAASSSRPVIASDISGCREGVEDGVTGILCKPRSRVSLCQAIDRFCDMGYDAWRTMGLEGRRKMKEEYDRNIVIREYLEEIESVIGRG